MATDTRTTRSLTIGELSEAIADGRISYTVRDDAYEITALDIRRFRRGSGGAARHTLRVDPYLASTSSPAASCQL